MHWLIRYLIPVAILGVLAIVGSFVKIRLRKPTWGLLVCGLLLVAVSSLAIWKIMHSPPGDELTVKERPHDGSQSLPATTLERLQLAWDSEAPADWPAAESLATISSLAYQPPVDASESYARLGFKTIMPVVAGSMVGYILSIDDVTVIAFRGTDTAFDWFTNLDLLDESTPFGPIHAGFYNAYQSMKPQIIKVLGQRNPKRLWITGHSLGGALAVVAAYDLIDKEKRTVDGVMTFGQPMVAKTLLANHLDQILLGKFAHFVNHADIVPRAPPGFAPCGSLVWFTDAGVLRSPPKRAPGKVVIAEKLHAAKYAQIQPLTKQEFDAQKAKMRAKTPAKFLPDGTRRYTVSFPFIKDHAIDLYLSEVRKLLGVKESVVPGGSKRGHN
jgi:triacylglycerol lipase